MDFIFLYKTKMRTQAKEPLFNSKELNKILPSYLLVEINEQQEGIQKNESCMNDTLKKEHRKVRLIYLLLIKLIIK